MIMESAQTVSTGLSDPSISGRMARSAGAIETPAVGSRKDRILGLDGLRGIAAFGVMIYHYTTCNPFRSDFPFTFDHGSYGVHLFFLISGFVIFMTVERSKRPLDFVKSRFARLYPAFWLSLLISFLLLCSTRGADEQWSWGRLIRRTAVNFTMVPGWFHIAPISGTYWTLGVEMTFYAIMFAILCLKRVNWAIPILTGVVVVGVADSFISPYPPAGISSWLRSSLALDYIPILLLGVLLFKARQSVRLSYVFVAALCLLAVYSRRPVEFYNPVEEVVITTILAFVVYLATTSRLPFLEWRPLVFLGTISYSLYLNHMLIGDRILFYGHRFGLPPGAAIAASMLVSLAVAVVITFQFELPIREVLLRRLGKGKASSAPMTGLLPAQPVSLSMESDGIVDIRPGRPEIAGV